MFKPVSSHFNPVLQEEQTLNFWKLRRIFAKSAQLNQGSAEFVVYDAPPTASTKPAVHHALARVFKDVFPRYKQMRGYHVVRRSGWDTHGLPVEIGVERQLGLTSKSQIESYGIDRFNELCRKSAFEFIQEWERFSDRIAFWLDMQEAYVTYTSEYIESVWWILKTFWERGLLYQGYKVVPYCPRCGTPLSDHEAALGLRETVDPSVYVRLPLADEPGVSLLVWTSSPWTLPANVAVAVHPDVEYVTVRRGLPEGGSEKLILARALLDKVFVDQSVAVVDSFKGRRLKGRRYQPLFTFLRPNKPSHYVVLQDCVTVEEGTGLVHIAPAFGVEDLMAAFEHDLPILLTIADDGTFIPEVRPWSGMFVKDADPLISEDLRLRGLLLRAETYNHTYPFCWQCDTPLLRFARSTWYIRTSQLKERLVSLNQHIDWVPAHIKNGRFGSWLEDNEDWALGRERYWGTPLPIWECASCHHQVCLGSIDELSRLSGRELSGSDLHRPFVDEIHLPCPECAGQMTRTPELVDVWFDSGSMPIAQWHYPFENQSEFRAQYPADFICEMIDQTGGWFYSLHAISALLFDSAAFKHVVCLGKILDAEGYKMSASHSNLVDPWEVLNLHGADALRWYLYTATPPGQDRRFSIDLVGEVLGGFTLALWNVYSFFVAYANLDGWTPDSLTSGEHIAQTSPLDRWLRSELHGLVRDVTQSLEAYDVTHAARSIQSFVDDLSKWYLRRSRRRFWKSELDADKASAYATLYETLVTLSALLAPTMPFLAETLYQHLVRSADKHAPDSVHLTCWPGYDPQAIDESLNAEMRLVMRLASLGHAAREQAGLKIRQPLQEAALAVGTREEGQAVERFTELLADELNVKEVRLLASADEAATYTLKPLPRQLGQKYQQQLPQVSSAILALDPAQAAHTLLDGKPIRVVVRGKTLEIQPDEVEVHTQARSGLAVASEGPYLAALKTELTPSLLREGLAHEFIHRIQELRKQAEFELADRIRVVVSCTPGLWEAVQEHLQLIQGEIHALEIEQAQIPDGYFTAEAWFDGQWLKAGIKRPE